MIVIGLFGWFGRSFSGLFRGIFLSMRLLLGDQVIEDFLGLFKQRKLSFLGIIHHCKRVPTSRVKMVQKKKRTWATSRYFSFLKCLEDCCIIYGRFG